MSYWDYRILSEVVGDHTMYYIAEVYYGGDFYEPKGWTERDFNALTDWDNEEDLRAAVRQLQDALDKPTLRVFGDRLVEQ